MEQERRARNLLSQIYDRLNETVLNPPAELGRLTDAGCSERSNKEKAYTV